jgi:hypothetical protein
MGSEEASGYPGLVKDPFHFWAQLFWYSSVFTGDLHGTVDLPCSVRQSGHVTVGRGPSEVDVPETDRRAVGESTTVRNADRAVAETEMSLGSPWSLLFRSCTFQPC